VFKIFLFNSSLPNSQDTKLIRAFRRANNGSSQVGFRK